MDTGVSLVAALGAGAANPGSALERVKHQLDVFEAAVRLTVVAELCFLRERQPLPAVARAALARSLARPSLGHWIGYHRLLLPSLSGAGWQAGPDWIFPLEDRYQIVRLRNTFAHSRAGRLLEQTSVGTAMEATGAAIRQARVLRDVIIRVGRPAVDDTDRICSALIDLGSAGTVDATPLLYWQDRADDGLRLLLYQSGPSDRRRTCPEYSVVDGGASVRLAVCGADFDRLLPLARWRNPVVEALGAAAQITEPIGRGGERAELATFLRAGQGVLLVDAEAGQGKTSLLRSVLTDLQGTASDGPALPPVDAEPVAIGYFIRRGTAAARPETYLDAMSSAIEDAYRMPAGPPAYTETARFEQLLQRLHRIETDESLPPLAVLVDALDESPRIAAYVPAGGKRVRVVVSCRSGTEVVPTAPWRDAIRHIVRLTGLGVDSVAALVREHRIRATEEAILALHRASGGNPLYLRFALTAGLVDVEMPERIEDLFDAVLARMPDAVALVRLLAEVAESLPLPAIEELLDEPARDLLASLNPRTNPFLQTDQAKSDCWSLSHDLARAYLCASSHGSAVPARLRAHVLRPGSYLGPAVGPLVRHGPRLLLDPGQSEDRAGAAAQLADLLVRDGALDLRLEHQDPQDMLADVNRIYAAAGARQDLTDTLAALVLRHGMEQAGRLRPEHLQSTYLTGSFEDIYPALLDRLCDDGWVTQRASGRTALLLMAFRYAQANLHRRSLDPARMAAARELLISSLSLEPATPSPELRQLYARERARISYDLGYLARLQGQEDDALVYFAASADAAGDGGDRVGVWVARSLTAQILFEARKIPGWLAQAGLRRAADRLAAMPSDTPHAARWIRALHEHGFAIAFRARAYEDAETWYEAIQEDALVRQAVRIGTSTLTGARWLMLRGRWPEAAAMLEPTLAAARTRWTEGAARELLDLGVARWHAGDRDGARAAWRHAAQAPDWTGNHAWRVVALRLLQDQPDDVWGW
jgi:hypothetical protein